MAADPDTMKRFFTILKEFSANSEFDVGRIALDKAVRAVSLEGDLQTSINNFIKLLVDDNVAGYSELDSDTRLQKVAGVVLGSESGDLSTATLPEPGSTTQITYTGDDGKSFTFNVKWPRSFTEFVSGSAVDSTTEGLVRLLDDRFLVELEVLKDALSNFPSKDNVAYYPDGDIYLRYLAKNESEVNIFVGTDENKNQSINFDGNTTIITNYDESNTINYNTDFSTAITSSTYNDFVAFNSNENAVLIRDVRGKMMNFANDAGGKAYAYMADAAGEIDGRNFDDGNSFEVIFGANNEDNVIRAGNGGSYLWGGFLGNDELFGGGGVDTFVYDINGGNDTVHNAESQDTIRLRIVDLSQITSADILDNGVNLSFSYGGTLNIEGNPTNFVLENTGLTYTADYQNKTWNSN